MSVTYPEKRVTPQNRREWLIPVGLILLSFVPVLAGTFRIVELGAGAPVTPANERFFAAPVPVVVHIVGATVYCVLGAFQFVPSLRRRRPGWHRAAGRLLIPAGLAAALSGLWMTLFYPRPADVGSLVTSFRIVFGVGMVAGIVIAFRAIRRGDVARHRAWMMRAYAIGIGAGTQAFTQAPWMVLVGPLTPLTKALLMLAGWLINLAVAEWVIRTRSRADSRRTALSRSGAEFPVVEHHAERAGST
ncbi:MAG TPA: DUF2306 domain-containing protein [Jiangellales bacterium]|nr:DUF2306 domain-containing protein [Jiangellales bacterium]